MKSQKIWPTRAMCIFGAEDIADQTEFEMDMEKERGDPYFVDGEGTSQSTT